MISWWKRIINFDCLTISDRKQNKLNGSWNIEKCRSRDAAVLRMHENQITELTINVLIQQN